MRVAFVVQRYGPEVVGGAELEARLVAERIAPYVQVDVLTTCAVDYMTWENSYAPGVQIENGVRIHRFPVATPRDVDAFNDFSNRLLTQSHSYFDEVRWMQLQGPDVPALFEYIQTHREQYDLFVFFTYLYATTFIGLQFVGHKSILVPTAHDEPWIHFDIFRQVFHLPQGLIFNSHEEDAFVRKRFDNNHIPGIVLGVGVEIPDFPKEDVLEDEYILYLGRVDQSKGCKELFDYFLQYKEHTHDPVKLVLIGSQSMPIPKHPDIRAVGYVEESTKLNWLQNAQLLVLPSPHESLSIATLEAWALGIPALVYESPVLMGHCIRGNGGLYFSCKEEFIEALRLLRSNTELRRTLGQNGQNYVRRKYTWANVTQRYIAFFRERYQSLHQ